MITNEQMIETIERSAEMVQEFHVVFGHPVGTEPLMTLPERRATERYTYLLEELLEGVGACLAGDKVEAVDAIGDAIYFCLGNLIECGMSSENLANVAREIVAGMNMDEEVKVTLEDVETAGGWARWLRNVFIQANYEFTKDFIEEATHHKPESEVDLAMVEPSFGFIASFVFSMKVVTGADPLAVMTEIHRSNMSKLLPAELDSAEACRAFMMNNGFKGDPLDMTFDRLDDMRWVAKSISTQKVIKNPLYSAVNLAPLVPTH